MAKYSCYVVKNGRVPGVYNTWAECEAQVKGFNGADFHGCKTRQEAEEYLNEPVLVNHEFNRDLKKDFPLDVRLMHTSTEQIWTVTGHDTRDGKQQLRLQIDSRWKFIDELDLDFYKKLDSKIVQIWTDGACSGNPGPGGWGVVLKYGEAEKELSGYDPDSTNNKMELTAAIMGLKALKKPCEVELTTDSKYLMTGMTEWIKGWKENNWTTKNKSGPVKNKELWEELDKLASIHNIKWIHVRGHADNKYNNRCDELATGAIKNNK